MNNLKDQYKMDPCYQEMKGWGREDFVAHREVCFAFKPIGTVKLLYFNKGKKCSFHFHLDKKELFFMAKGSLEVTLCDRHAKRETFILKEGERIIIHQGMMHQMKGLEKENILLEVSTTDYPDDSYRIEKGD